VVTKYHKGRHSLFLYNSEIFYAFTQDILRSHLKSRTVVPQKFCGRCFVADPRPLRIDLIPLSEL